MTIGAKFVCPVCGQLTLKEEPPGTFEICGVCGWEDDDAQFRDPDLRGGANEKSLNETRARWEKRLDRRSG